jgi:hypothetical protein
VQTTIRTVAVIATVAEMVAAQMAVQLAAKSNEIKTRTSFLEVRVFCEKI